MAVLQQCILDVGMTGMTKGISTRSEEALQWKGMVVKFFLLNGLADITSNQ